MTRRGGGGSVVNISSWAGLAGTPFSTSYTASKFAVRGFTKAVAMEVARTVLFIASDDASYTTGAEFSVDGGWAAGSPVSIGETHAQYGDRA